MAFARGPKTVTDGLEIAIDISTTKSYPRGGTSVFDLSGNGRTATLNNGPTFLEENGVASIDFDGSNDHMTFANIAAINYDPDDSFTLMAVFRLINIEQYTDNLYSTNTTLFGKGSTGGSVGLGLRRATNGQLSIYAGSRGVSQITEAYNINANQIYCTTFSYTPTIQKLYVNGALQSSSSTVAGAGGTFDNTGWRIFYPGAVPGGNTKYGEGNIYLARLYSKELTAQEVSQNYEGIRKRFGI